MTVKRRCLLGMSGGTDSSVAAMLLQEKGFEVVGVTFRFWDSELGEQHTNDAIELAQKLNVEHFVYDAQTLFKETIVGYFIQEYLSGRTPVPCIKCNNQVKWRLLSELANEKNCELISTGHYCNVVKKDGYFHIKEGLDEDKDQAFFLWGLSQEILSKMYLPLGELTKTEVRKFAHEKGFERISSKKDSLGICFSAGDYRDFLKKQASNFLFEPGNFVDETGAVLGKHQGFAFYTVGQRRGLGLNLNVPMFVKRIDAKRNEIVLAPFENTFQSEFFLQNYQLINPNDFTDAFDVIVKIRYRNQANHCRIIGTNEETLKVELQEPLNAVAPGQAAAFYRDGLVLGGGIII